MPKCKQCGQPLTLAERARFVVTCDKCTEKMFLTEIAPNIGKRRDREPTE